MQAKLNVLNLVQEGGKVEVAGLIRALQSQQASASPSAAQAFSR
jgi:hypothetical protein